MNPEDFIRPTIRKLEAYHVEPHPANVILDANESSYPLPNKMREGLLAIIAGTELNRYPDPDATMLKRVIAKKEGANEKEILLGNGSDEIIQTLIAAVCDPQDRILAPSPTFTMYKKIAQYLSVETVEEPLNDDWDINRHSILGRVDEFQPKIVFIASPNNPTGIVANRDTLATVMNTTPGLVVIDEAYVDYAERSVGLLFRDRPNVVILKTISKIGLAGARLGYMMADERLIEQVNKTRLPYNINSMTQAVAAEVMRNWDQLLPTFEKTKDERTRVFEKLAQLNGITPFPSEANFILMRVENDPAKAFENLLEQGVRVRWFKGNPRLGDCFRVTIGTPAENDLFLTAIEKAL
ncbi:Histidinol-phosphate aminotransferase [hydrothermal vent metagenome]|uniref:Histidinol-phosphate aminotransferase n=1 Tax=hydrothermal vent metagenome TaxID=652676 RepID=A0A3B1C615_9ZZZZ